MSLIHFLLPHTLHTDSDRQPLHGPPTFILALLLVPICVAVGASLFGGRGYSSRCKKTAVCSVTPLLVASPAWISSSCVPCRNIFIKLASLELCKHASACMQWVRDCEPKQNRCTSSPTHHLCLLSAAGTACASPLHLCQSIWGSHRPMNG